MRTAKSLSAAFLAILILPSSVRAIVIGDSSTPEQECVDYKYSAADFKECIKNVKAERAEHDRFLRAPEKEAKRKAESATRLKAARDACVAAGVKLGTVRVGMPAQTVRDCGWGNPSKINSTTTAAGTSEQWVYSSGNYLYVQDGKVTAIQH